MKTDHIFWKAIDETTNLKPFSHAHITCLLVIFLLCFFLYTYRNSIKNALTENLISHIIAYILILHQISLYIWYISNNKFTLKECLPLYPCRISIILCIIMMFNKSQKIFDVLYFWGIGGATISLLFHDTTLYPFPHYIFIQFFISHGGILISVLFMMFIHGYYPNLNSLKRTFKYTLLYFLVTIPSNYLIGSNYCYLRENPNLCFLKSIYQNSLLLSILTIISFFILFYALYIPYKSKSTT